MQKKKALCEITNPYRMLQAIWLTLQYPEYEWDIAVRYVDGKAETVHELADYCTKSGCFGKVYEIYSSGIDGKLSTKIKLFFKIFLYLITFRKRQFFEKTINDLTDGVEYQLYCAENALSFVGASMMNLGKDINVFVLEDGMCDYSGYEKYPFGLTYLIGLFLYKLGIVNYISKEYFSANNLCIKYAVNPDLVWERNYKEIRKLFDDNLDKYNNVLNTLFDLPSTDFDILVFTDISKSTSPYEDTELFMKWLLERYKGKKILIKSHPRDNYDYRKYGTNILIGCKTIPGEVFLNLKRNADFVFMGISTLILHTDNEKENIVTHFSTINMNNEYEVAFRSAISACGYKKIELLEL